MIIKPLATCPECHGEGYLPVPDVDDTVIKCPCLVRAEAIDYLPPLYAQAEWNPDFQTAPFIDRNVLCQYYGEPSRRSSKGGPEAVTADGGAIILIGHETTALSRSRGTLRSLRRTHRGRHGLAASHLSS
jgi:hypothetical protein